eukprot:XP_766681.1 hypothetical protein [Theileria parva strain Muguga]
MLRLPNSIGSKLINPNFNYNISRISCFNILRINYFSTNVFNDKTVDFQNLPFNEKFVNNLKSLGIDNLKLFQYYTFKLLTDKLAFLPFNSLINSRINNEERLKIVLYNDLNTGKTIGTLLPFLYRFSTAHSNYNETTVNGFDRKLLIICNNNNEVKKLINFIISVDSSLNIAQLTAAFVLVLDKHLIQIRESVLRSHDFEFGGNDNIIVGTRERLIGDKRTDLLKLEIDLNRTIPITDEKTENTNNNNVVKGDVVESCLCKVLKNRNKLGVIRNLIYCNYNLPTFLPLNLLQKLTTVKFRNNCLIFTNRKNLSKMAEIEPFKSLSVQLQNCVNSYERAEKLNLFNSLNKPLLLTTQLLNYNLSLKNVNLVIFHTFPREDFYKHLLNNLSNNSKIIILYNKMEYGKLIEVVKKVTKNVKVQTIPSNQFILNYNLKILNKLVNNVINEKREELVPYLRKSEELIKKYNNSIINYSVNLLINDNVNNFKN